MTTASKSLIRPILAIVAVSWAFPAWGQARPGTSPREASLRNPPPGVAVITSAEIPASDRDAIGAKLGGRIERLTNSSVRVHGRPIQVNVIVAADEASAEALWKALNRLKKPPFLVRNGRTLVEYVASDADLARKTSWEFGFVPKPGAVKYRVRAELATVDKTDDQAADALFQACLQQSRQSNPETAARIAGLASKFRFGKSLALRDAGAGHDWAVNFEPKPVAESSAGSCKVYEFADLPLRHAIPFVTATIETAVPETDNANRPPGQAANAANSGHTAATPRWPVDDPAFRDLAASVTAGKVAPAAKVDAILAWLAPGRNIRYEGQAGSRWGTARVLEQKFGHCWDFSDLFVTLARASGIPARQVAGWLYGSSGHVWAEWHDPRRGWIPVDPTGGGVLQCGIYHIAWFTSDDGELPIVYLSMPVIEVLETR